MKGNGLQTTRFGEFHVEARVALVITRRVSLTAPGDASLTRGRQVDLGRELSHSHASRTRSPFPHGVSGVQNLAPRQLLDSPFVKAFVEELSTSKRFLSGVHSSSFASTGDANGRHCVSK